MTILRGVARAIRWPTKASGWDGVAPVSFMNPCSEANTMRCSVLHRSTSAKYSSFEARSTIIVCGVGATVGGIVLGGVVVGASVGGTESLGRW